MTRRRLILLGATALAVLLAGCGTSQKEDQGNNQGSSQRMSEATNTTLVDRCADSASTGEQQKRVGNVLDMLAGLLGKAGVRGEVSRGEVSRGEVSRGEVSNGKIAFSRNNDIHVIDGEGARETPLTHTQQLDEENPVWSPDGQKIAFTRDTRLGRSAHYVMNADGTNKTRLAVVLDLGSYPSWSPDGQKMAFTTEGQGDESDALSVINVDGTHKVSLSTAPFSGNPEDETLFGSPVWSPAGNEIAFASRTVTYTDPSSTSTAEPSSVPAEGLTGIYLIEADGTGLCKLTSTAEFLGYHPVPVWSPDGERIAFYDMDKTNVIKIDGSRREPLAGGATAAWSPDGQKLAFVNDSLVLDMINADGSGVRRLANTSATGNLPAWSPDGEKIAFPCPAAPGAAGTDLCVINADGTEWKRIALKVASEGVPVAVSWGRE